MMLTIHTLPSVVAEILLAKARREGRSIQEVAVEALQRGLRASPGELLVPGDDPGSWVERPEFEQALLEFARLDG